MANDGHKRWTLRPGTVNTLISFTAEELAHLQSAAKTLQRDSRQEAADALAGIESKVRALMQKADLCRAEADLDLISEAESLDMRPGPRQKIDMALVARIRKAILSRQKIRLYYRSHSGQSWHKVCPYGFLYGNRPHLVAFSRNPQILDFRNYRLSGILDVEDAGEPFERDPHFSLEAYARQSFGMYQEQPFDVAWKFAPSVAGDVREYEFHPDQTMETLPDGGLIVRFRAGGRLEMAWHLYTWGKDVEVLEPKDFWRGIEALRG